MKLKLMATSMGIAMSMTLSTAAFAASVDQLQKRYGPWLDLKGGGIAEGRYNGGSGDLVNGTVLPASGYGFERISSANQTVGTGLMISLLENSAAALHNRYPEVTVAIADIAQDGGGRFSPHRSHQNGLDADILYIGSKDWESMTSGRGVNDDFDFVKNWEYWRSLAAQRIVTGDHMYSVVNMIFVNHSIKRALCRWTKENGMLSDPLNRELMGRLFSIDGHDSHFHLRLRCSPYHSECNDSEFVPDSTGC